MVCGKQRLAEGRMATVWPPYGHRMATVWPPYGHRMATVWLSGHLHLLHHVVANAVCTFPNVSSLFQASRVRSAWGL